MLKESLDQLIRDIVSGKHIELKGPVPLQDIMEEVRRNTSAEDEEILNWIKHLTDKRLIRVARPNAYIPEDLDKKAKAFGIFDFLESIDEEADSVIELGEEDK